MNRELAEIATRLRARNPFLSRKIFEIADQDRYGDEACTKAEIYGVLDKYLGEGRIDRELYEEILDAILGCEESFIGTACRTSYDSGHGSGHGESTRLGRLSGYGRGFSD